MAPLCPGLCPDAPLCPGLCPGDTAVSRAVVEPLPYRGSSSLRNPHRGCSHLGVPGRQRQPRRAARCPPGRAGQGRGLRSGTSPAAPAPHALLGNVFFWKLHGGVTSAPGDPTRNHLLAGTQAKHGINFALCRRAAVGRDESGAAAMGAKLLCLCLLTALLGYYIYSPLPDELAQPWTVMLMSAALRTVGHLSEAADLLGLMHYMDSMRVITVLELVPPTSDENVTVTDTEFNKVPVRLYLPRRAPGGLRRAMVYFHGGGWCLGDAGMKSYDHMSRRISNELDAVVVSVNYRVAPQHRFPAPFEDVYSVTKFFLQSKVLSQYGVDPARVCVAGDSAGGNLAAAVAQQLLADPEVKTKLKAQILLYPALQALDLDLPSYRDNAHKPLLPRSLMVRFWSEYLSPDPALRAAMASNRHAPAEAGPLLPFVDWRRWLPAEMRGAHEYRSPVLGGAGPARVPPGLLDPRAAPLLAGPARLRGLPAAYILTCQHDVLRDDGAMYAARLRAAGVPVTHHHAHDAFHAALMFTLWPLELAVGHRLFNAYLDWLKENL